MPPSPPRRPDIPARSFVLGVGEGDEGLLVGGDLLHRTGSPLPRRPPHRLVALLRYRRKRFLRGTIRCEGEEGGCRVERRAVSSSLAMRASMDSKAVRRAGLVAGGEGLPGDAISPE